MRKIILSLMLVSLASGQVKTRPRVTPSTHQGGENIYGYEPGQPYNPGPYPQAPAGDHNTPYPLPGGQQYPPVQPYDRTREQYGGSRESLHETGSHQYGGTHQQGSEYNRHESETGYNRESQHGQVNRTSLYPILPNSVTGQQNFDQHNIYNQNGSQGGQFNPQQPQPIGGYYQGGDQNRGGSQYQGGENHQSGTHYQGGEQYRGGSQYQGGENHQSGTHYQGGEQYRGGSQYQGGENLQSGTHYQGGEYYRGSSQQQGGDHHQSGSEYHGREINQHGSVHNAEWEFENRTRTAMSRGICFKEVETSTLVKDPRAPVPRGNGTSPNLSRVQVCCEGYERNIHNFFKCDPVCRTDCINGICIAPDHCECYPDHIRNLAGICVATCPIGCANGDCHGRVCQCKPGYTLDVSGKFCSPKCGNGCGHGNCSAPDTCVCDTGYEISRDNKMCVPKCSQGCVGGDCTAPEVCVCAPGLMKIANGCQSLAQCANGCRNGRCVGPNKCECNSGYQYDEVHKECVFHCEQPCYNGVCSGPNECRCNHGYINHESNSNQCVPHCPNGCPNGTCSGPNMCICNMGFVKDRSIKGSQRCVPRV